MTYCQLYTDIVNKAGEHAAAYCWYLLDRPAYAVKNDDSEVPPDILLRHDECISRLMRGEPVQYIFGYAPFYDLEIECGPGVLIPRYDTETLAEEAIKTLPHGAKFADLCCGSGCIAAAVLHARGDTSAVCLDISDTALAVTERNLKKYGLDGRAEIRRFDVFGDWKDFPAVDAVLCNPPYISADEMKDLSVQVKAEPFEALYGGEDGLDFYRKIIKASQDRFSGGVHIIFEIGYGQAESLRGLYNGCVIKKDLSGNDRICIIRG